MAVIKNSEGKFVVERLVKTIQDNKEYLSEVDGAIGDGDHGINMNKGFTICGERIAERDCSMSEAMETLGDILMSEIGGSMGPIYGTVFMESPSCRFMLSRAVMRISASSRPRYPRTVSCGSRALPIFRTSE